MLRHIPSVVIETQCGSDNAELDAVKMPKRERRLRHSSPSPTRSQFLRIVRRNDDATENGKRSPHGSVKRCHSYHDIEQAAAAVSPEPGRDERGRYLTAMSTAAAVSSSGPVGGPANSPRHLSAEEPRPRKSSGGSHNLFSLGLRFGGKGKGEKKKKDKKGAGDLPSPAAQDHSLGDPEVTLYR